MSAMDPSILRGADFDDRAVEAISASPALDAAEMSDVAWSQHSRMESDPLLPGISTNQRRDQLSIWQACQVDI